MSDRERKDYVNRVRLTKEEMMKIKLSHNHSPTQWEYSKLQERPAAKLTASRAVEECSGTGVVAAADGAGIRFISDEIYHGITFGRAPQTALALDPDVVVVSTDSPSRDRASARLDPTMPEPRTRTSKVAIARF